MSAWKSLRAVEEENVRLRAELSRCHRLALKHTGSASVEPVDQWLERFFAAHDALESHHTEHHASEDTLRAQVRVLREALDACFEASRCSSVLRVSACRVALGRIHETARAALAASVEETAE